MNRNQRFKEAEAVMSPTVKRSGLWSGTIFVLLNLVYAGLLTNILVSGSYPPVEPYQTMIHVLTLLGAPLMIIFWSALHSAASDNKKLFSRASLAMIVVTATLTSINRYVALTAVRQSLPSGASGELRWFLPYAWPSVMLAIEVLAWGYFFALACLLLAPVFSLGRLERGIFWTLVITGVFSLLAGLGQILRTASTSSPLSLAGPVA